jgi:hypothetical protein
MVFTVLAAVAATSRVNAIRRNSACQRLHRACPESCDCGRQTVAKTALCFQMVTEGKLRRFLGSRVTFSSRRWQPSVFRA